MSTAPLHFLLMVFAGWVNRRQLEMIEYLKEENRVLREQMGGQAAAALRRAAPTPRGKSQGTGPARAE